MKSNPIAHHLHRLQTLIGELQQRVARIRVHGQPHQACGGLVGGGRPVRFGGHATRPQGALAHIVGQNS